MSIKISKIETFGWEAALRGMRNSRESWDKSDSGFVPQATNPENKLFFIGPNDLELATKLAKLGGSDAKFRRMIHIQCDILAPLYWWKEFDTYKIGTVSNSTSTMYGITKREFNIDQFSQGQYMSMEAGTHLMATVNTLNDIREKYLNFEEGTYINSKKMYWYDLIRALPSSYNQLRTVDLNYEVMAKIMSERMYHKQDEWRDFCRGMMLNLPYSRELIMDVQVEKDEG